jgi:hypothetical protein
MGIWQHTHTVTPTEVGAQQWNGLGGVKLQSTIATLKLHPTSMSYIYKVFEHLKQLWMGIWQHIHTVTTTEVSPDVGDFADILDDVSVEMIPLHIVEAVEPFKLHLTSMSYIYLFISEFAIFRVLTYLVPYLQI